MTQTSDPERAIVQEVVRRLMSSLKGGAVTAAADTGDGLRTAPRLDHQLSDRVVTLESLRTLPAGLAQLHVSPTAVITPAAVDELRRRGVSLMRDSNSRPSDIRSSSGPWLFATTCGKFSRPAWDMGPDRVEWVSSIELRAISDACRRVVQHPFAAAIVFSQTPALVACQLNRHENIRAIVARDALRLDEEIQSSQTNVLVVDLRQNGVEQRKCVEIFARLRPRPSH